MAENNSIDGFYVGSDVGVNIINDVKSNDNGTTSFEPGIRWDLTTGYAFKLAENITLAPEAEVGVMFNSFKTGNNDLVQVPLLVNLVLNWHMDANWVVYAGGGGGANYYQVSGDSSSDETVGAWQVMGGIRYKLNKSMDLGLGCKYFSFTPKHAEAAGEESINLSLAFHF